MIYWDTFCPPAPGTTFTKAKGCAVNIGVFYPDGSIWSLSALVYIDEACLTVAGVLYIKKLLAATIEAIFAFMGEPDTMATKILWPRMNG